jgi:hypothetical protein
VLNGKIIAIIDCIKKSKRSQIKNLTILLKLLEKTEQAKLKNRRWEEITNTGQKLMKWKPKTKCKESVK